MMNPAAADSRAAALSVLKELIDDLPISPQHKAKLWPAVEEYVAAMPDVPIVTANTALAFVRRLSRRLHCRA